jgi:hypothetical protein
MNQVALSELARWITEAGLAGKSETALLDGFCRRAVAAGLPLARAMVIIDTLHPVTRCIRCMRAVSRAGAARAMKATPN